MIKYSNAAYELSYDDDFVVLVDKKTNELIIRVFGDNIKTLNVDASKSDFKLNAKSVEVEAEEYVDIYTKTLKEIPSIFLNTETHDKEKFIETIKKIPKPDKN